MKTMVAAAGAALIVAGMPSAALAQSEVEALRAELDEARARSEALERRVEALERALTGGGSSVAATTTAPGDAEIAQSGSIETVGAAPSDFDSPPQVAILGMEGNVITRAGQLTAELQLEYARADRNRALFRGIEVVESVLIGVFDINESRQDVVSAAAAFRYGITNGLEVGVRVPFIYRSDRSVLAPVAGSTNNDPAATIDNSANATGIGDVELTLRYQLTGAEAGRPFLIGNLQLVAPTGRDAFEVPRDSTGRALDAATGAGFWGVSPSVTAILPTDPAVLFGTLGYTFNFARDVDTIIPPVRITRVDPGDAISASAGIGITFNQRTSLNLGYAHSWAFGTKTRTMALSGMNLEELTSRARDLQLGRFLFGLTYRVSDVTSVNWSVEVGATDDATDLRTVLRIPTVLFGG